MPVQFASTRLNLNPNTAFDNNQNQVAVTSAWVNPYIAEAPTHVKAKVLASTAVGVIGALALILKCQKLPIKPTELFKGSYKDWPLWKVNYKEFPIITLGASSVMGGLIGGYLFDKKEHFSAKCREAVIQFIGNVCIPIAFVSTAVNTCKHFINKEVQDKIPEIKVESDKKLVNEAVKTTNKAAKAMPLVFATAVGLISGIFVGNKVGNLINEHIFKVKDNRKLKPTDMSPHVDDVCFAVSLADEESIVSRGISRVVPIALLVPGYQTGTAQEKQERLQ